MEILAIPKQCLEYLFRLVQLLSAKMIGLEQFAVLEILSINRGYLKKFYFIPTLPKSK